MRPGTFLAAEMILRSARVASKHPTILERAKQLNNDRTEIFKSIRSWGKELGYLHRYHRNLMDESLNPVELRSWDSDDVCTVMATLLIAAGYEVRIVLYDQNGSVDFHHVWLEARRGEDPWISLDAHTFDEPGKAPEGGKILRLELPKEGDNT